MSPKNPDSSAAKNCLVLAAFGNFLYLDEVDEDLSVSTSLTRRSLLSCLLLAGVGAFDRLLVFDWAVTTSGGAINVAAIPGYCCSKADRWLSRTLILLLKSSPLCCCCCCEDDFAFWSSPMISWTAILYKDTNMSLSKTFIKLLANLLLLCDAVVVKLFGFIKGPSTEGVGETAFCIVSSNVEVFCCWTCCKLANCCLVVDAFSVEWSALLLTVLLKVTTSSASKCCWVRVFSTLFSFDSTASEAVAATSGVIDFVSTGPLGVGFRENDTFFSSSSSGFVSFLWLLFFLSPFSLGTTHFSMALPLGRLIMTPLL